MADLKDKIDAEMENISVVIEEINKIKDKPDKSNVELAGIGTFLHNFYNGVENVLKQILNFKGIKINNSETWHQDLLKQSFEKRIISEILKKQLAEYLAFRHFFVHSYGFLLNEEELKLLVYKVFTVYEAFKGEIYTFLSKIQQ